MIINVLINGYKQVNMLPAQLVVLYKYILITLKKVNNEISTFLKKQLEIDIYIRR